MCRVPEGTNVGQPVRLRDWQREILAGVYGSPTRRAIISYGRKNGKTSLAACLLLLHLCGPEARPNAQLFSDALSRDQAAILFALAAKMVRLSPDLSAYVAIRDTAKQLVCGELGTLYRALSADAETAFGLSPSFMVHDELGQVRGPRSRLYEALETAAAGQPSPLSIVISTQAPTDGDLLSVLIDDAKRGEDPRTKLFLWAADLDRDPFDVETIKQANPAFGDFQNADEVVQQAESARRMPSREAAYRNLILNQRINLVNPFISRSVWEANGDKPDADVFNDSEVFLGLDLSARNDLTALVAVAQDVDGVWHVDPHFFVPQVGIGERSHRDRVPYDTWAREGWLHTMPGASVDYARVAEWLVEYCEPRDIGGIAFDRWRIDVFKAELARLGAELPLQPFGQGFKDMTPALDTLESELANQHLRHGLHPVLTMCAANAVATRDPSGNRKLDKSKATGRIDGMVALAMAMGVASAQLIAAPAASVYETRGIRFL